MPALYKIYVSILAERREVKERGIVPQNQIDFRKGMGVMDNIYALNYLVNRQLGIGKGSLATLFVDLKAAFDSVDRKIMIKAMRERGIREELVERVEQIMRETRSRVRVGGEVGERFWTGRGVRQGCPLSPLLFNILIADMEEMGKMKWGGVKLGEERYILWCMQMT